MKNIAKLSTEEQQELFQATAISMGMQPIVIEKDFWVCFMLDHLFHDCKYRKAFVFNGGTSLSKSYREDTMPAIRKDYEAMRNMIYGNIPDLDTIIEYLKELEKEIHAL